MKFDCFRNNYFLVPPSRPTTQGRMNFAMIAAASFIGVAIALLGLNFWHATNCAQSKSSAEIDGYVDALNKRLLQAESQVFIIFLFIVLVSGLDINYLIITI